MTARRAHAFTSLVLASALLGATPTAFAQPEETETEATPAWGGDRSLLGHLGPAVARGLLRGGEVTEPLAVREEVLRGVDRAVALGTLDGVAELVKLLHDPRGLARTDATVLLALTRALGLLATDHAVAHALAELVLGIGGHATTARTATPEDPNPAPPIPDSDRKARLELARETAALALAEAGTSDATVLLLAVAGREGPGRAAATRALLAFPPSILPTPSVATAEAISLAASLGDLRARDAVLEASGSVDRAARIAGLRAVGELGELRGIPVAVAAMNDPDPRVREAAAGALVDLGAKEAPVAVRHLVETDATVAQGVVLASRVSGPDVTGALAARIKVSSDLPLRRAAIGALGSEEDALALGALRDLLADPLLSGDAALAIARSASPAAWGVILASLETPKLRRLGARMAAVRGRVRPEGAPREVRKALRAMSAASDVTDRQTATLARVFLGDRDLADALADPDAGLRRAGAMAGDPSRPDDARAMAARFALEPDPDVRTLLSRALAAGDVDGATTTFLLERTRAGDIDAPLAALALARHGDARFRDSVVALLGSADPVLRAHAARGLASTPEGWAVGLLADAYEAEVDPGVRAAIVTALALRSADAASPTRAHTLARAAHLDPDAGIRTIAVRARSGLPPPVPALGADVVWLRAMTADGAAPPGRPVRGVLLRADGVALPVLFDADGYALVPAPPGAARLVLAPRPAP